MAKIKRMFFGGNTANGFYSFHDNIMNVMSLKGKKFFILKGMPGGGKSSLMKKIGEYVTGKGYDVIFYHCPSDPESLDSILINELGIAIADGTAPHVMDPIYPGLREKIVDLSQFIDSQKLKESEDIIISAKEENKRAYYRAFSYLRAAKNIYELIAKSNSLGMDFNKLNIVYLDMKEDIFSQKPQNMDQELFKEMHAFSAANTPEGVVDYTDTLLDGVERIYFIDGEIGTGKSTLIKKIADECKIRGYSIEVYHNSTFPEKIETLIIKNLNTCITSNNNATRFPHSHVDLNRFFNEKVKNKSDYEMYDLLLQKAIGSLADARRNHEIIEKIYIPTIDYDRVNEAREKILEEIISFMDFK